MCFCLFVFSGLVCIVSACIGLDNSILTRRKTKSISVFFLLLFFLVCIVSACIGLDNLILTRRKTKSISVFLLLFFFFFFFWSASFRLVLGLIT